MDKERMESILSKMKEELQEASLNSVEEEAVVEDDGEDGEMSPMVKSIMNACTEMLLEIMKPSGPNAGKSIADVFREAAKNAENEEEME